MKEILSKSLKDTQNIAEQVVKNLSGGDVLALIGDLGGGKTTFTKALARVLGVKDNVQSPTFTIVREYQGKKYKLYHLDLYRLKDEKDAESIGFSEIISNPNAIIVIEWAERFKKILPKYTQFIEFDFVDENTRRIIIK